MMKIDWIIVRELLHAVDHGMDPRQKLADDTTVSRHVDLLREEGLVTTNWPDDPACGYDSGTVNDRGRLALSDRGHDFLSIIGDEVMLEDILAFARRRRRAVTVETLPTIAVDYLTRLG